jgi:hypothetical protein
VAQLEQVLRKWSDQLGDGAVISEDELVVILVTLAIDGLEGENGH